MRTTSKKVQSGNSKLGQSALLLNFLEGGKLIKQASKLRKRLYWALSSKMRTSVNVSFMFFVITYQHPSVGKT